MERKGEGKEIGVIVKDRAIKGRKERRVEAREEARKSRE